MSIVFVAWLALQRLRRWWWSHKLCQITPGESTRGLPAHTFVTAIIRSTTVFAREGVKIYHCSTSSMPLGGVRRNISLTPHSMLSLHTHSRRRNRRCTHCTHCTRIPLPHTSCLLPPASCLMPFSSFDSYVATNRRYRTRDWLIRRPRSFPIPIPSPREFSAQRTAATLAFSTFRHLRPLRDERGVRRLERHSESPTLGMPDGDV